MKSRSVRTLAVLASVGLIVGAFAAAPADAAKKKKKKKGVSCATFTPGMEEAAEAEVVKITPAASEDKPVVIEYEHGPAGPSIPIVGHPGLTESLYFNIQLYGSSDKGLWIKQEFSDRHDLDLYLYNEAGDEVTHSGGFNTLPQAYDSDGNATENSENIPGYPGEQCAGYTIQSTAYLTPGTDVTLSIWYGDITEDWTKP